MLHCSVSLLRLSPFCCPHIQFRRIRGWSLLVRSLGEVQYWKHMCFINEHLVVDFCNVFCFSFFLCMKWIFCSAAQSVSLWMKRMKKRTKAGDSRKFVALISLETEPKKKLNLVVSRVGWNLKQEPYLLQRCR